jgi:hypothetical protein
MPELTEQRARELADSFVKSQPLPAEYTLDFESIRVYEDTYQVRYSKMFKEPTKENPPYRLVIVGPDAKAHWGNP